MGRPSPSDEELPEVVSHPSPQARFASELATQQWDLNHHDKYPVVYDQAPKILDASGEVHVQSPGSSQLYADTLPWEPLSAGDGSYGQSHEQTTEKRICGLGRRPLLLGFVAFLIILGAAVGGGVGGSFAAARAREGSGDIPSTPSSGLPVESTTTSSVGASSLTPTTPSDQSTSRATKSSTSRLSSTGTPNGLSSTSPTSSTTKKPASQSPNSAAAAATPTPTFLNNQTGLSGFAFQGFSEPTYMGAATPIIREEGFHDLGLNAISYVWLPSSTGCCVTFCQDKNTASGYWCEERKREKASGAFPRIYVWCGQNPAVTKANETCS